MVVNLDKIEARHQAYLAMVDYARGPRRDELIRQAADAGISKSEIAVIMRVHRSTVYAILSKANGHAPDAT